MTAITDRQTAMRERILQPPSVVQRVFDQTQLDQFSREGAVVARRLFGEEEVAGLRDHFMRLREGGTYPGDSAGVPIGNPDAGATSSSEAGGDNTGIPTGTKTRDQTWQVIQYLLSAPVQVEFLAKLGSIPVRSSMGDNPYFKANPRMATFAKTLAIARTPYTPKFNELFKTADSPLIVRLDEAVRGLRSVSEALSLAEQEIDGLLGA